MPRRTHKCRSFDEWVRAMKINAMPLVEIPVNVNHVLILSNPLPSYHGARASLAKLFVANGRLVMGTSLGDKVVIVIALLLLAVVAVVSAEFPGIIRAARLSRPHRVCSQSWAQSAVVWRRNLRGRRGEEPAATCCISGVVRNGRSRRLGRCRARWPRFARHREHRSADRGQSGNICNRPRRARRHTSSNRTGRGRCLCRRYGERQRRFVRPSSDAAANHATRINRFG